MANLILTTNRKVDNYKAIVLMPCGLVPIGKARESCVIIHETTIIVGLCFTCFPCTVGAGNFFR